MTRQTRIGLLVALAFIILFGLVLGDLTESPQAPPQKKVMADASSYFHTRSRGVMPDETRDSPVSQREARPRDTGTVGGMRTERATLAVTPQPPRTSTRPVSSEYPVVETQRDDSSRVPPSIIHSVPVAPADIARVSSPPPPGRAPARTYKVKPGDSLIRIARTLYGSGREMEYKRIYQANRARMTNESSLTVGMVLTIPPLDVATPAPSRPASESSRVALVAHGRPRTSMTLDELSDRFRGRTRGRVPSGRIYVVRRGDSLTTIAQRVLRDSSQASIQKIYNANRDKLKNPNHLPVGVTLRIPA